MKLGKILKIAAIAAAAYYGGSALMGSFGSAGAGAAGSGGGLMAKLGGWGKAAAKWGGQQILNRVADGSSAPQPSLTRVAGGSSAPQPSLTQEQKDDAFEKEYFADLERTEGFTKPDEGLIDRFKRYGTLAGKYAIPALTGISLLKSIGGGGPSDPHQPISGGGGGAHGSYSPLSVGPVVNPVVGILNQNRMRRGGRR